VRGSVAIAAVVLACFGGCYGPEVHPGAECAAGGICPAPLRCSPATNTCEDGAIDAAVPDDVTIPPPDGEDVQGPPNDRRDAPEDITAGGTFTVDLATAHDDIGGSGCGGSGGRDVFYSVSLSAPRVYYLDTFGSSFDSVIRVYAQPCSAVTSAATPKSCVDDACSGAQSQVAVSLPTGDSCVVVDQQSAGEATGSLTLHVVREARDGEPLAGGIQMLTGDTCSSKNVDDPVDVNCDSPGSGGKDLAYFFTACPGQSQLLDATTCVGTSWDTVLYVRRGNQNQTQIGCNDDTCNFGSTLTNVSITNSTFFWLILDGFDPNECGQFNLQTNLR
jgi:hypothetical protein